MSGRKQSFRRPPHRGPGGQRRADGSGPVILYGWHSVTAALANPARRIRRLLATENALRRLAEDGIELPLEPELVRPDALAVRLTPDAVHQGLIAEADPLPSPDIEDLPAAGIVLVLDQITDPHNVGAILRSGRGVCRRSHRHHGAAQSGGHRRAGQGGVRRARTGPDRHRAKPGRAALWRCKSAAS